MAVGDWAPGSYISLDDRTATLPLLGHGIAFIADVDFDVILPSGARVLNGGSPFVPYHFEGDPTLTLQVLQMQLVAGLAASQGLDVHLTVGIVHPDGSLNPYPLEASGGGGSSSSGSGELP